MTTDILLIRHGQASFGASNYDVLSPQGRRQAEVLAAHLSTSTSAPLDRVIHGNLMRQRDTAAAYLQQPGINGISQQQEHPGFNEFQAEHIVRHYLPRVIRQQPELGQLLTGENGFHRNFQPLLLATLGSWQSCEFPREDLESWPAFRQRVRGAMADILANARPGERIGIFTSGGVIAVILQQVLGADDSLLRHLNYRIANASISHITHEQGQMHLSYFNNYSHLQPADLVTFR